MTAGEESTSLMYSGLLLFFWLAIFVFLFPFSFFLSFFFFFFFFLCVCVCLFRAAPTAYGGSQARGRIGAVAAGLHHSHSNTKSELRLPPTSQLEATPDP